MKIAFGNDHAGFSLKPVIIEYIKAKGHEVMDFGSYTDESTDYPVFAKKAAEAVANGECDKGILICGTGIGIGIAANKVEGIRCAICSEPLSARLSREHNNANMLAVGARIVGDEMAKAIVGIWLDTEFSGEEKHVRRIGLIE